MGRKSDKWLQPYLDWRETPHGQEIFEVLCAATLNMASRGSTKFEIRAVAGYIRYRKAMRSPKSDTYKINNNYLSFLARDIMAALRGQIPDEFYETREADNPSGRSGEQIDTLRGLRGDRE